MLSLSLYQTQGSGLGIAFRLFAAPEEVILVYGVMPLEME